MNNDVLTAMKISVSGMKAQGERINVIAQNIANAGTLPGSPEEEPYRRKIITFENEFNRELNAELVVLDDIDEDKRSDFGLEYMPNHPAADENGYVQTPNVQSLVEMQDMKEAQRSYEANLGMVTQAREMYMRTVDLLRR